MISPSDARQFAHRKVDSNWSGWQSSLQSAGGTSNAYSKHTAFRSLLVPLDGTPLGEHAIPHAVAIASRTGAVVHLAHVHSRLDHVEPWQMSLSAATIERRLDAKNAYLRDVAERLRRTTEVLVNMILIDDHPVETALADAADGFDLVVIASRRPGLIKRIWAPSVADRIRHNLQCPTLIVRGSALPVDFTSTPTFKNVLLPLNGSALSSRILDPASALAVAGGASMTLLNVQDETWTSGHFVHDTPAGYLIGTAKAVRSKVPVTAQILRSDERIADAVIRFSKSCGADLIAVATGGGNALSRFLRGSVTDGILRNSSLPILVLGPLRQEASPEVITVFP